MRRYLIKKTLLIIPSLVSLVLIVFFLSKLSPGDPVENLIDLRGRPTGDFHVDMFSSEYKEVAEELGLGLPLFYISVQPLVYPDTLYKIVHPTERKVLKSWLKQGISWPQIQSVSSSLKQFYQHYILLPDSIKRQRPYGQISAEIKNAYSSSDFNEGKIHIENALLILEKNDFFHDANCKEAHEEIYFLTQDIVQSDPKLFATIPRLHFHAQNQFHHWISRVLVFDFGISMVDAREVREKVGNALFWTFLYIIIAYFFSILISIPLGLYSAWNKNRLGERILSLSSFIFYAFPVFWIATLAVVFLTNDIYSDLLNIFPSIGLGRVHSGMTTMEKISEALPHLLLPGLILALHSAAQGIRIVRNSASNELKEDYFITGKAKGLSNYQLIKRHIFPNSMLPVVTLLVSGFPSALAGSVVLEVIFNIPGMGRLLYDSIHFMDWNVVFAILMFIGLMTFIFYLLGDLIYAWLNPKINYGS